MPSEQLVDSSLGDVCYTPLCPGGRMPTDWLGTFCYRHGSLLGGFNFVESNCDYGGGRAGNTVRRTRTRSLGVRNWEEEGDKFRDSLPSASHFQMPAPALGLRCGSDSQTSLLPLGDLARPR